VLKNQNILQNQTFYNGLLIEYEFYQDSAECPELQFSLLVHGKIRRFYCLVFWRRAFARFYCDFEDYKVVPSS